MSTFHTRLDVFKILGVEQPLMIDTETRLSMVGLKLYRSCRGGGVFAQNNVAIDGANIRIIKAAAPYGGSGSLGHYFAAVVRICSAGSTRDPRSRTSQKSSTRGKTPAPHGLARCHFCIVAG